MNPFSLQGKNILVTGASSGIGRTVAIECAEADACCFITARNRERLQSTISMMKGEGHSIMTLDLTDSRSIDSHVDTIPKLDGIVCCAGIVETQLFKFTDEQSLQNQFSTNTFSVIRLIRALVQKKKLNRKASIVIISSISGVKCAYIGGSIYGATKGALEGFSKALALELSGQQIRVNTVTPGMIETHLLDNSDIDDIQMAEDKKKYPLKRYGKPEDVAYAVHYLLSDASEWMTGTSLLIDGGYTLN